MATLNNLTQEVKKKLGLTLGTHTINFSANVINNDTITINGIVITFSSSGGTGKFFAAQSGSDTTVATNFKTAFDAVFTSDQSLECTRVGAIVTVTGARTIVSSNESGASVNVSDTEMDPPVRSDILTWIKEAQLDIVNKLSDQALIAEASSVISEDVAIETVSRTNTLSDIPADFLRPIVFRYKTTTAPDILSRAEKVPFDLLMDIRDGRHPFYLTGNMPSEGNKWYSIFNGLIQLAENTSTTQDASLIYVKKPQTTATSECDLPESLEKLAIDYACSKALNSIGKEEEGQLYLQQYFIDLQSLNAKYVSEEKDSHELKESKAQAMSRAMESQRRG